jgi:hypothetical protein
MKNYINKWKKYILLLENVAIDVSSYQLQLFSSESSASDTVLIFKHMKKVTDASDKNKNKPIGLYTSSLKRKGDSVTSEWIEMISDKSSGMNVRSISSVLMFKAKPSAKIFKIDTQEDYNFLLKTYGSGIKEKYLNWTEIAKNCDCINFSSKAVDTIPELRGWDVEQSCWFNPEALEIVQQKTEQQALISIKNDIKDDLKSEVNYVYDRINEFIKNSYAADNQKEKQIFVNLLRPIIYQLKEVVNKKDIDIEQMKNIYIKISKEIYPIIKQNIESYHESILDSLIEQLNIYFAESFSDLPSKKEEDAENYMYTVDLNKND